MIQVTLDLGNVPSVLAAFNAQAIQKAVNAAAESYNDDVHDWIDSGRGFTTRTGQLEGAANWRPAGNGSAEIYANTDYAHYVEDGTNAHVIRPKNGKSLRFPVGGGAGFGFARVINHPGSKAHPFFFADLDNRMGNMEVRALSVLAHAVGGSNG
jgi:hypothetical protein